MKEGPRPKANMFKLTAELSKEPDEPTELKRKRR